MQLCGAIMCTRSRIARAKWINASGDGPSNEGVSLVSLHARLRAAAITVNAIAIEQSEADLTAYFYKYAIMGGGAFVKTSATFADYPEGMRRKLLREVTR